MPDPETFDLFWSAQDADDRRAALAAAVEICKDVTMRPQFTWQPRDGVRETADEMYRWLQGRDSLRAFSLELIAGAARKEGTTVTATINLEDDQVLPFTLAGRDAKGAQVPAPADTYTWSTDDPDAAVGVLTVSDDGLSASLAGVQPGTVTVSVAGQNTGIQGAEAVIVTAGPAVTLDLVAGAAEPEQPAA